MFLASSSDCSEKSPKFLLNCSNFNTVYAFFAQINLWLFSFDLDAFLLENLLPFLIDLDLDSPLDIRFILSVSLDAKLMTFC